MEASRFRGGDTPTLDEIRADLEAGDRTMTQRRQAFDDLRRHLEDHPDDREARRLLNEHEEEFTGPRAEAERVTDAEGIEAVGRAQEKVGGDPRPKTQRR